MVPSTPPSPVRTLLLQAAVMASTAAIKINITDSSEAAVAGHIVIFNVDDDEDDDVGDEKAKKR